MVNNEKIKKKVLELLENTEKELDEIIDLYPDSYVLLTKDNGIEFVPKEHYKLMEKLWKKQRMTHKNFNIKLLKIINKLLK